MIESSSLELDTIQLQRTMKSRFVLLLVDYAELVFLIFRLFFKYDRLLILILFNLDLHIIDRELTEPKENVIPGIDLTCK